MQAVIYVEIGDMHFTYEKPLLTYIKQHYPQVIQYDIDNSSEAFLIHYAEKLLEEASQILIIIAADEGKTHALLSFFEKLLQCHHKCLIIYNGTNVLTERYLNLLEDKFIHKQLLIEDAQNVIQQYFLTSKS